MKRIACLFGVVLMLFGGFALLGCDRDKTTVSGTGDTSTTTDLEGKTTVSAAEGDFSNYTVTISALESSGDTHVYIEAKSEDGFFIRVFANGETDYSLGWIYVTATDTLYVLVGTGTERTKHVISEDTYPYETQSPFVNYLKKHETDQAEASTDPSQTILGRECSAYLKESWWGGSVLLSRNRYFVDPVWDVCLRYSFEDGAGTVTASMEVTELVFGNVTAAGLSEAAAGIPDSQN